MGKIHDTLSSARQSLNRGKTSISKIVGIGAANRESGAYHYNAGIESIEWADENSQISIADGIFHFEPSENSNKGFAMFEGGWDVDGLDKSDVWGLNAPEHIFGWIDPFD